MVTEKSMDTQTDMAYMIKISLIFSFHEMCIDNLMYIYIIQWRGERERKFEVTSATL